MRSLLQRRFQLQLLFALLAAASVAALAVELVSNAIQHAESFVLAETGRTLGQALDELRREYRLRLRGDAAWDDLPVAARDVTLRGISQTVLSSYPGVEGGFWIGSRFLGYFYPTHDGGAPKVDMPAAERPEIERALAQACAQGGSQRVLRGKHDLVVIAAVCNDAVASWTMKRLPGQAEPAQRTRNLLLAVLVGAALLGAGGVLATGIGLHRGVAQIASGLRSLDENFTPNLPERHDELGEISAAINEMAVARRRLEAELRREDRARTVGRLVGRIAHEMRNPLNSIRLSLQMLAHRQQENRLKPGDFQIVIDEVDRINRLLSDLLAFQQPRPPKNEARPVGPILEACARLVQPQAEKRGVRVAVESSPAATALLDEQYVRQIVMNLLLNAIDASEAGTRIGLTASAVDGHVSIRVSDNGPGLSEEQQERLFEPFYTTKANGHGLGLAVSRELAQSMGGKLSYEGNQPSGTSFVLQLRSADVS
jgi:signal transduction histidine kinase